MGIQPPGIADVTAGGVGDHRLRSDLLGERGGFRVGVDVAGVVIRHVVAIDDLDAPQVLDLIDAFEAGHQQPQREALLRTERLAVHAVGNQAVVHRLAERDARRAFHFFGALGDDPRCAGLDARFLEQQRERHAGPFGAAGQAVRLLNGFVPRLRAVAETFDKVNLRDERQPLQLVHREDQRPIDHAVDHQAVLVGVDLRDERAAMRRGVEQR